MACRQKTVKWKQMSEFKLFWKWWLNPEGSVISLHVFMQFNFVLGFKIVQDYPPSPQGGVPLHPFHICSYCSNNCTFFFSSSFLRARGEKKENLTMLPAVSSSDFNKSFASLIFKCDPLLLFIASVSKRNAFPGRGSDNIRHLKTSGIWDWLLFPLFDFPFLECKISCWRGLSFICAVVFSVAHIYSLLHMVLPLPPDWSNSTPR